MAPVFHNKSIAQLQPLVKTINIVMKYYQYYQTLNLPVDPLKRPYVFKLEDIYTPNAHSFYIYGKEILTDELVAILEGLGLKIKAAILFCYQDVHTVPERRLIHSDVYLGTNDEGKLVWKDIICGINWELNGNDNMFTWWDTSAMVEIPQRPSTTKDFVLSRTHFGAVKKLGIESAVQLDEVSIQGPTLLRTNIPHMVYYDNSKFTNDPDKFKYRVALTIRFEETWTTWEEALEVFSPISTETP